MPQTTPLTPLRALVVDDTALYRRAISETLARIPGIEVAATASNGRIALAKLGELQPDLMTLDIEMPELNGIELLEAMASWTRKPGVIVLSSHTRQSSTLTMRALDLGAFDFVTKPDVNSITEGLLGLEQRLSPVVQAYAGIHAAQSGAPAAGRQQRSAEPVTPARRSASTLAPRLAVVGVSTGGPQALGAILPELTHLGVPLLVVQHMPPLFTGALAESLQRKTRLKVKEAEQGEVARANCVYIAPGGRQMKVKSGPAGEIVLQVTDDPAENHCRPAVDYLFRSVALNFPGAAVGLILTGMGSDGAQGLKMLRRSGCHTIAQDEATSIVFGMPRAAVAAGAVEEVVALPQIPSALLRAIEEPRRP